MRVANLVLCLPFLLGALWAAEGNPAWTQESRELYYGIPVQVNFSPADPALAAKVWTALEAIDPVYNDFKPGSEISRINAGGPGTYPLSGDLAEAFALAGKARELSGGTCEITVGPLRRLWRGAEKNQKAPEPQAIAAALKKIGPATYRLTGNTLEKLVDGVQFDFGGVVKGMAVDRAIAILRQAKVTSALVQCGGETGCFGQSPHVRPFRLGIPHPDDPDGDSWCRLACPESGFSGSTSGNYRQPVVIGGTTYYHIYDPRTGLPTDTHVLSASVAFPGVTGKNGLADAMTKCIAIRGPAGIPAIEALGAEALVLVRQADGTIAAHRSAGWDRLLLPSDPPEPQRKP